MRSIRSVGFRNSLRLTMLGVEGCSAIDGKPLRCAFASGQQRRRCPARSKIFSKSKRVDNDTFINDMKGKTQNPPRLRQHHRYRNTLRYRIHVAIERLWYAGTPVKHDLPRPARRGLPFHIRTTCAMQPLDSRWCIGALGASRSARWRRIHLLQSTDGPGDRVAHDESRPL